MFNVKSYQANESFECHFFDDGLKVHHKRFARTNDALVIQNNNLKWNKLLKSLTEQKSKQQSNSSGCNKRIKISRS